MSVLAPSWALSALALDGQNDPHLAPGRHLRLMPAPALGLPLLPLRVHRANLGNPATAVVGVGQTAIWRGDVRCTDSQGYELTLPFTLPADGRVDVWLPAGTAAPTIHVELDPAVNFDVVAELLGHSAGSESVLTQRSAKPYTLSAARVEHLRLRGKGRVLTIRWVNAAAVAMRYSIGAPWRSWSLPLAQSQNFYTPSADALAAAQSRVGRGAPRREPLPQVPQVAGPSAAPLIPQPVQAEWIRLAAVRQDISGWLPKLTGIVGSPHAEVVKHTSGNPAGTPDSVEIALPLVESLWLSALDPGLARWIGFADIDEDPELLTAPGDVVAYVVAGIWQASRTRWWQQDPHATLLAPAALSSNAAFDTDKRLPLARPVLAAPPYWSLMTVAATAVGVPAARPAPPYFEAVRHRAWLPAVPPAARREVVLELGALGVGPGLAIARMENGDWKAVNRKRSDGRVLPLVAGPPAATPPPPDAPAGMRGRVLDRRALAGELGYRAAQCDLLGRWSEWSLGKGAAAPRPAPPVPQPSLHPFWADEASWPVSDAMAASLRVSVPVPFNDKLAPGSRPLSALRLQIGNSPVFDTPLPPGPGGDTLVVTKPGPALQPCTSTTVKVVAWWVAGVDVSKASEPLERPLHDPRPPAPVSFEAALAFGSRPDATGKSRIELRWTPPSGQALARVVHASETVLLSRIRNAIATPAQPDAPAQVSWRAALQLALNAIMAATTLPTRAAAIVAHTSLYPRAWFELLERDPRLQPVPEAGRHVHEVSGKLQTLALFRVVPVSASNVEGAFNSAPMIAFAVPNLLPPPQPLVEVRAGATSATLIVTVPPAAEPALRYRLRRTRGRTDIASGLPAVATGDLPPPATPGQAQTVTLVDAGLLPWQRYGWRVEVQGADLPGSGVTGVPLLRGAWSRASEPVSTQAIPSDPPPPVAQLELHANQTRLRFAYSADAIDGGASGRFRFVVMLRRGAGVLREAAAVYADAPAAKGGLNVQTGLADVLLPPDAAAGDGVVYSVVVVDPLGRRSLSNPTVTAQVSP